jgi:hypothetical protein
MDDISRFIELVKCGNSCISIATYEEYEALEVVRHAAEQLEYGMLIWSVDQGMRNGFFQLAPKLDNHEPKTPAAGLAAFLHAQPKTICVALDLAPFLVEQVTLRTLRDVIHLQPSTNNVLVLIDSQDTLPEAVRSYAPV